MFENKNKQNPYKQNNTSSTTNHIDDLKLPARMLNEDIEFALSSDESSEILMVECGLRERFCCVEPFAIFRIEERFILEGIQPNNL